MGILKLMDFIKSKFPGCIVSRQPQEYSNKIVAIDASNTMYQFLIKTQTITRNTVNMPTDWLGNKTGHLLGLLSRGLFCVQNNIKPVWVFDGRPPLPKYKQLSKRKRRKEQAYDKSVIAEQHGDLAEALKQQQRSVSISETEKMDAVRMLRLMGMPVIMAPGQAEAQCAHLCKMGLAYGVVSEDMDTLTHGAQYLIRNFNKKGIVRCILDNIQQIELNKLLTQSELTKEQFIDFCILCGCDYTGRISNIGPMRAYKLIQQHEDILQIVAWIKSNDKLTKKYPIDSENFNPLIARSLFTSPTVTREGFNIDWKEVDEPGIKQFLMQREFSANRINNWLAKATLREF